VGDVSVLLTVVGRERAEIDSDPFPCHANTFPYKDRRRNKTETV